MILKKDKLQLGLVLGLLGPIIGLLVIYLIKFSSSSFGVFLEEFFSNNKLITSIGSLALLANVILFTIYINTHRDKTARGIFLVTLLFGIGILILKLFN
ncbi:MAG: hypothetical protein NVV59_06745 [Chitinophagaceae bacterium]|nr:hypothetical protein [Chitinophagaceae bacterium]